MAGVTLELGSALIPMPDDSKGEMGREENPAQPPQQRAKRAKKIQHQGIISLRKTTRPWGW